MPTRVVPTYTNTESSLGVPSFIITQSPSLPFQLVVTLRTCSLLSKQVIPSS